MSGRNDGKLRGVSTIAGEPGAAAGEAFHAYAPADGRSLEPTFFSATNEDLERAITAAAAAAPALARSSGRARAVLLRAIADGLDAAAPALIDRAHQETALPLPRLTGEVARTSGQMRHFAAVLEEGSWVMARIDTADPGRTPPKPDLRSMLRPLGLVAVFGASNFPLAFSVAGGDTASALAAGNPVIVKAHPAHPGTSELAGRIIDAAVAACGFPAGTFSLLFDAQTRSGSALVQHPRMRAVAFTGSTRGGRALMDLAAARPTPIPVYAEMGSTNPVFLLPGAMRERGEELAAALHGSFTLGAGQFCTKPGLLFLGDAPDVFLTRLRALTATAGASSLLTSGIARAFGKAVTERATLQSATGQTGEHGFAARTTLLEVPFREFAADASLQEEIFGPSLLVVREASPERMLAAAHALHGHLTATVLGTEEDLRNHQELLEVLETKVGRLLCNGFPTGVEVAHAMVHGGPYPATSDGRSTSVGSQAILRFARPVCFQNVPDFALPPELQDANPCGIHRLWNGTWQPGAVPS